MQPNAQDQSSLFNKTDIKIFQELFPDRSIKAQRFIELGLKPVRSPKNADDSASAFGTNNPRDSVLTKRPNSASNTRKRDASLRIKNPKKRAELDVDNA